MRFFCVAGCQALVYCCFLFGSVAFSQDALPEEEPFFTELYKEVNVLIERHIATLNASPTASDVVASPFQKGPTYTDSLEDASSAIALIERRRIAKDVGLNFNLGYIDNFTNGLQDQGFFYRRAFQTGLDWNILKDGWIDSKYRAREFLYQQQINTLLASTADQPNEYAFLNHQLSQWFEEAKHLELKNRQSFSADYLKISKKLYYKKLLLWDDILELLAEQAAIDNMISTDSLVFDPAVTGAIDRLPVFKIDEKELLLRFTERKKNTDSLTVMLQEEYLNARYKAVRDLSLKPYVRYNYYDYEGVSNLAVGNRDFVSVGIQFSVPLPLRVKENRSLRELKLKEVDFKNTASSTTGAIELKNILLSYEEAYGRYLESCYRKQVIKERIRREQVKLSVSDEDYSPVTILKELNEFYKVKYELITTKEELYLLMLRLRYLVPEAELSGFTQEVNFESGLDKNILYDKSMYVWSGTFGDLTNEEIVKAVKNAGCRRIILSIDQNNELKMKAYDLNTLLIKDNIELHMMIANNKFIYASEAGKLAEAVEYLMEIPGIKGIHLDIEPHVIPELKTDRNKYQDMYVAMLKVVRQKTKMKGLKLSVSIPVFYEKNKLVKIYSNTDKVYLMAYENPDLDFIKRKTEEELSIDRSKTIVALRTKDFASRKAMNQFVQQLSSILGTSEFAIHDLKTWNLLK
ncbi:MAG: hypothetical protein H7282_11050 [Cytophagaceae bacterium]|nr:hypothetical protein [Cytophagaceae bacterium]